MRETHLFIWLVLCILILFAGCDQTFQPLTQNDVYHFSIYGYLNVSADTQWVRVGTVRQIINEAPDPTGIQVTLEDMQSGKTVVMKDSLFASKGFLNYWTTMDIEHEQTYRITAEGANEKTSRVTVTTPKEVPPQFIITIGTPAGAIIFIDEIVEPVADIQSVWHVILNPDTENRKRMYRFPISNTLENAYSPLGTRYAFANWDQQQEYIERSTGGAEMVIASRQFFVAAGGPEWNDSLSTIDDLEYFLDGGASNVENGLGYVVGIDAKWFNQATCLTADQSGYVPCMPQDGPYWYTE